MIDSKASAMEALLKTSKFDDVQAFMFSVKASIAEGALDDEAMGALLKGKNHQSPQQLLWEGLDLDMEGEGGEDG
eukprot:1783528-Pyramimonas_sp.AAC.1